jgi:hypothetical protein
MNVVHSRDWVPDAAPFVAELARRADAGYATAMVPIAKALTMAGAAQGKVLQLAGARRTKAAFLLGCCAEEVAMIDGVLDARSEKAFLRAVAERLRPHARALTFKRIGPDLRRLVAQFRASPARTRLQTVAYMLEVNAMGEIAQRLDSHPVAQLAIECTVGIDGVAGVLVESMRPSTADAAPAYSARPR